MMNPVTLFKCLSDETRLYTVLLLQQRGEMCVCELMAVLNVSQPKVSRHLAPLREQGIVSTEKRGQWVYYRLHPQLEDWAQRIITDAATASQEVMTTFLSQSGEACCD